MKFSLVLKRILKYTKPHRMYIALALIFAVGSVILGLFVPVLTGNAIDHIVEKGNVDFEAVMIIIIKMIIIILMSALFQWLLSYCTNCLAFKTVRDIRADAHQKLNNAPLSAIDPMSRGDVVGRMINDAEQISTGLLQGFTQLFTGVVTIVSTIVFMLFTNVWLALDVILLTPLSFFTASTISKKIHSRFIKQAQIQGELTGFAEEMIGNQKTVKAFCYEESAQRRFDEINQRLNKAGVMAQFSAAISNPTTRFVNACVYAAVGIVGSFLALGGGLSIGHLSMFLSYAHQYTKPFNEISGVITELQSAFAGAERVFEIIDTEQLEDESAKPELSDVDGDMEIENVSFSYNPKISLIENFNLSVKSGQRVAIVGPTGCGKTTFINLLMRFYETCGGNISVDSQNIKSVTRDSLRRNFGMVLQETWVFTGSVRENLAFAKPDATDEEIVAAAKMAHAHSFIRKLPEGYDTLISEDGEEISQGQKQLLCIARLMLLMPPMLILDEATSSIDTRTEQRIQRAFAKIMKGKTSFVVAHRLSTVRNADIILVMNKGKIIEQGNHEELMNKGGFYANLYESQFER